MDAEAVVGEQACAVDFLMEAGTAMIAGGTCDKRTALQSQTQRAAMDDAVRCDGRCTALRWTMHCTTSFHPNHSHEARRTQQPNPTAAHRSAKTTPLPPVHTLGTLSLIPQKHLLCRLLGTARQTVKRNTRNSRTGRSEPRGRTMKDVRQDGAGQKAEKRKTGKRTERAKRTNEKLRMRSGNTNGRLCCACHWNIILCKSALESGTRKLLHQ